MSNLQKQKKSFRQKALSHTGKVALALVSSMLIISPVKVGASDATEVISDALAQGGGLKVIKEVGNAALEVAKSKPAMALACGITCLACIPAAGAAASPGICIACGILIAKTLG